MEHSRSCIINIPVQRVCAKVSKIRIKQSQLQRRFKSATLRKPRKYSKDVFKYVLPVKETIRADVIKKDTVLLLYRLYVKGRDKIKHKHQLNVTIQQKYKMTLSEYRSRLHVEDPPDEVKAVTDIDKGFFNYVNGRPLVDRAPLFKTLKTLVTCHMRTKLEVGYRHDQIYNIDANLRNDMKAYKQSLNLFYKQTKYLDNFISEDYRKSIALLNICDEFEEKLNRKLAELHLLADQQVTIVSNLIGLDYMYYLQQSYGRFLYYLSPPSWRANNRKFAQSLEIEVKGFDLGGGDEETFNVLFDKMKYVCLTDLVRPALYFTESHELLELFDGIEKQQLNYLDYVIHLAPHLKQAKEDCKVLKDLITNDSAFVLTTINSLKAVVDFSEARCAQLESNFFKLVNGLFYESVGAPEVIRLFLNLEFCYEKLYLEKPMNLDIFTLAKDMEAFYMYYWKCLDAIISDKNDIGKAVKQCEEMERKKFRRAKHANRLLWEFDHLQKNVIRAFAPPTPGTSYKKASEKKESHLKLKKSIVSKKLKKQHSRQDITKTNDLNLSASQLEYLELFTDWTCNEDPFKYLHLDSVDEIKHN